MASSRTNHNRHVVMIQPDSNFEEGRKKFKIKTIEDDDFSMQENSNEEDHNLLRSKEYLEEGVAIRLKPPRNDDVPDSRAF